ncbi:glycosyltransferase family 4 protein [Fictibacillus terranigra]|uniref:Glycosyltransferase family 4 protein n=1 Tax=Fictibacillus terranigra TaxID=3058424 RepID=A0ABT8E714_9BACL|nr:glycosyltransferase family 4 protein [Fictibacillus sp. CENA-BCM004]MDN4073669.1 glycosyltransferase family 4 protein [Fictibacillus sp. CENA-BCM004]
MKILLATFWSVPHVGGVWNYMEQLKKKLESLGHQVDLLGYGEEHEYIYIVNKNQKVYRDQLLHLVDERINEHRSPAFLEDPVVKYYEIKRFVYEFGLSHFDLETYDLIHTQDVLSTACIRRVNPKRPVLVATLHGCVAHELKDYVNNVMVTPTASLACEYFDNLEHDGATSAEITIVANQWLKNILKSEFNVPDNQIHVRHYGYDIEAFLKRMKKKSSIPSLDHKKVILYTGRLVKLKGLHHLISALGLLKSIRNDWVCWIVGEGEKEEELQAQSRELGLEDTVIFCGKRDDIPQLLAKSDIFVLPSLLDNQPLSVIEAQIVGKPVIVSDAGGLPEIVEHGVTGLVTRAGDETELCNQLNLLLENEEYRNKLGINAKKWGVAHWSFDKGVSNVLDVYQEAISKRRMKEN